MSEIVVRNLTVKYKLRKKDEVVAINDLSCEFPNGKINVILGESGSGKTTLLKSMLGLKDYSGNIELDGLDIAYLPIKDRNFAYVSQKIALHPKMTLFDNIAFPLKIKGFDKKDIIDEVFAIAKELNIFECLSRKPKHVSIGQAQRAALARSLVKKASIYFFDEPLSNIDEKNKADERRFIKETISNRGASAIYVTHDINEALVLADNIFILEEGKLIFKGTPKQFMDSKDESVVALRKAGYGKPLQ